MDVWVQLGESAGDMFGLPYGQWAFTGGDAKSFQNSYTQKRLGEHYSGYESTRILVVRRTTGSLQHCSAQAAAFPKGRIAELRNLQQEARLVKQERLPLLIMFLAQHCPYCVTMKDEFLKPMLRCGLYVDKELIRRIEFDGRQPISDFNGESLSVRAFASRYKVFATPTVVFIVGEGRALTDPLVGIATDHYYSGYLDDAIDTLL